MKYYAHSLEGEPPEKWQPLEDHLQNVAKMAGEFAAVFGAKEWSSIAGELHDFGKGTKSWQAYLRKANQIVDEFSEFYSGHPNHAAEGAKYLFKNSKQAGKLLAYCIAGHHGGLPNWMASGKAALQKKLEEPLPEISFSNSHDQPPTELPFILDQQRSGFQFQFFVRMLFSCLVDADFLDTEAFLDTKKSVWRSAYPSLTELHARFWKNFNAMRAKADHELNVNIQREKVLTDCLVAADSSQGIFSLTVPTGGGKTLASLAFALNHSVKYGKERIIYVIPFTSIIEQNAAVFRKMLGDDAVLEHHCNFVADDKDWKGKLAIENWDAPIIITTNVQFFDSFFAAKTSKCRKLHNIANSVVIFDEVQAIPVEKLIPCLEVIKELSLSYSVTSVLCTATQPAVKYSEQFQTGLEISQEVISNVPELFAKLKRTEEVYIGTRSETEIAEKILEHEQALCIVNTRQQALDIFASLPDNDENFHLSALMHPVHRTVKLTEIREKLKNGNPCRVISTQLIEAGVDVDFPVVYRAVAGIDSIAQAAGRCNRNGLSKTPSIVSIFSFPDDVGCSFFRLAAQSAEKLFDKYAGDLTSPECVREYFDDYFWKNQQRMDLEGIVGDYCKSAYMGDIQFRNISQFQMIETATNPVIIALDEDSQMLVDSLNHAKFKGNILRKLQKYTVQIYSYQLAEITDWLETPLPEVWVLRSEEIYSEKTGLICSAPQGAAFFG